jgi:hypothetical protein
MKKIIILFLSFAIIGLFSSCGGNDGENISPDLTKENLNGGDKSAESTNVENLSRNIQITIGDIVATAELDESDLANQFLAVLPQTISMTRGRERVYYGRISESLTYDDNDAQFIFKESDVGFWISGNSLSLFFDDKVDNTLNTGVIMFGKLTSDSSVFASMRGSETITVTLLE